MDFKLDICCGRVLSLPSYAISRNVFSGLKPAKLRIVSFSVSRPAATAPETAPVASNHTSYGGTSFSAMFRSRDSLAVTS